MRPVYKPITLAGLAIGYSLLLLRDFGSAPFIYGRLWAMCVGGAVLALFVQGPQYGVIHPVSTRSLMIMVGIVLMGTSLAWTLALRGHI